MATIIAAVGGGAWTVGATWLGGAAPTAADDVQLTVASGNVTIDAGAVGRSLDCTGYTGTLTHPALNLVLGDATAGAGNVALKFSAGMTYARASGSRVFFVSTSATQQTITTAGKGLFSWDITGAGSSYILGDAITSDPLGAFGFSGGTFNTGNFACSWGLFVISSASAKTLTLGSSAIAITGNSTAAVNYSGSNATFTANTAVFTFSGASAGLAGSTNWNGSSAVFNTTVSLAVLSGQTLNNVTYTGPASKVGLFNMNTNNSIDGTLTVTGNSATNRILMQSNAVGTARTVTVTTGFSFSNCDITDITAAGAAGTWTGTSMGNALGNTNITFDTPATQTRSGAGGNYSTAGSWTSRVPLPQDNVVIGAGASGTITADMPRLGADVDFTGFAGTAAFNSTANTMYGSLNLASGMTISGTQTLTLAARSSKTITSNGRTFTQQIIQASGSYTLADALNTSAVISINAGTFSTASFALTTLAFTALNGTTVTLGTSVVTVTATGLAWSCGSTVALSAASATVAMTTASATARSFAGGGQSYGTLTYTVAGSTGSLTITGANTFATINFSDASNARSLLLPAGVTTTVGNFDNVRGTAGKLMTVDSSTAVTHTLSKSSGVVSTDYLNVAHSIATGGATWYAGANSVDAGNNTGWNFTAPPVNDPNAFFFMFEGAMV